MKWLARIFGRGKLLRAVQADDVKWPRPHTHLEAVVRNVVDENFAAEALDARVTVPVIEEGTVWFYSILDLNRPSCHLGHRHCEDLGAG